AGPQDGSVAQREDYYASATVARTASPGIGRVTPTSVKRAANGRAERRCHRAFLGHHVVHVRIGGAVDRSRDLRPKRGAQLPLEVTRRPVFGRHCPGADSVRFGQLGLALPIERLREADEPLRRIWVAGGGCAAEV